MKAPNAPKISRNQPCPCNSGKKYKHCCASSHQKPQTAETATECRLLEQARQQAFQFHNFAAAEQCYRQVLTLNPNNPEALGGVGQSLYWRHRRAEGRIFMTKTVKILLRQADKTDASVLLQLADQLQLWGEIELALQLIRATLKKSPQNPKAQYGLAACLHRLNYTDQALQVINALLKQLPNDSSCHILTALLELDKKNPDSAINRLEHCLQTETDPAQQARICLELAKAYDKSKRYQEAFTLLRRAGELHQQLPAYQQIDAQFVFDKIALYKQGYDAELLQRWSSNAFADASLPAPVFLIGFLRSGTTLTEQVLSAHPDILTSDENHLLDEVITELESLSGIQGNLPLALKQIDQAQAGQLRRLYWRRAGEEYGQSVFKKRFVNKVALNSIEIGLISCLFPEAKLIFALRDPRDICLSCALQSFTASPATINMQSWDGIAKQYAAVMDLWLSLRDQIPIDYLELRYEDTVTHFETSFRKVFKLLELDWHADIIRYHQNMAGRFISTPSFNAVAQPLYQSAIARWIPYAEYFQEILPILNPYIEKFGYALNPQNS